MKLLFFFVSAFLILCERQAWTTTTTKSPTTTPTTTKSTTTTTTKSTTTTPPTTTKSTTTTKRTTTTPTTTLPTTTTPTTTWRTTTTGGPGVNLKGKMFTLSQYAGVTFFPPYYSQDPWMPTRATTTTTTTPTTTTKPTTTTTNTTTMSTTTTTTKQTTTTATTTKSTTTTTAPVTGGVSVCLRYVSDSSSFTLFKLAPRSPLSVTWNNPWYAMSWYYYSQVSLNPRISLWSSVRTQPWTSVCVVLDSLKNVVQVFQGGAMSIRKILSSRMVWSGEPVLEIPGFDGQVTDVEVWDYPLQYKEVFGYMQNYGSSGSVLTWSNIAYRPRGKVLVEETYTQRSGGSIRSISCSEAEEQLSGSKHDKQRKYKKMVCARREKRKERL